MPSRKIVPGILLALFVLAEESAQALPILDCDDPTSSSNGQFFAVPGPKGNTTQVYRWIWPTRVEKIWEKPGWHCDGRLSNDGEYLVAGDDWSGQINRGYKWDQVMLRFYHRDTLIRAVPLREVLLDPNNVSWNDCSSMWATSMGFVADHRFGIDTADDRSMVYDVTTGALVEVRPSSDYERRFPGRIRTTADLRRPENKPSAPRPGISSPKMRAWPVVDREHPVYSKDRRYYAAPSAERTMTQVFRNGDGGRSEKVWEKAGWVDGTALSNDGEYLVTGYPGVGLLDGNYTLETAIVTFYRRGTLIRAVPFREIIIVPKHLRDWKEGYEWGGYVGFISAHRFAIDTVEDRRLIYDVTTGEVAGISPETARRFQSGYMDLAPPGRRAPKNAPVGSGAGQ